jgi:hypothetical protein
MNFTTPLNTADIFKTAYTKFYKFITCFGQLIKSCSKVCQQSTVLRGIMDFIYLIDTSNTAEHIKLKLSKLFADAYSIYVDTAHSNFKFLH